MTFPLLARVVPGFRFDGGVGRFIVAVCCFGPANIDNKLFKVWQLKMLCKVITVNMQTVELLEPADSELLFKSIQLEEYPARQKTPPD